MTPTFLESNTCSPVSGDSEWSPYSCDDAITNIEQYTWQHGCHIGILTAITTKFGFFWMVLAYGTFKEMPTSLAFLRLPVNFP